MAKKEQIDIILNEQIDFLKNNYSNQQWLGLFVYGKANYNFIEDEKDIKTVFCYIPTMEELYTTIYPIEIKYIKDNKDRIIALYDIRLLYELLISQSDIVIEILSSNNFIINPKYKKVFDKYIFTKLNNIFNNETLVINNFINKGIKLLNEYKKDKDIEKIFQVCKLRIMCELYSNSNNYKNYTIIDKDYHINYLLEVLEGKLVPNLEEIEQDFKTLSVQASNNLQNNYIKNIQISIIEFTKVILVDMLQPEQDLLLNLTKTEEQALNIILQNLNSDYEGNISISQLVQDSNISRPVFKNVIQKMKDSLIAEIDNQGVKGTYIKILNEDIINQIISLKN